MENPYQKTFPTLMADKKIIYVHGFGSAGSTHTAQLLREMMPQATVIAPDLPVRPADALELLHNLTAHEQPDLIIGTSMGGMYTEQLYGYDRICVNPAFQMAETMRDHGLVGKQTFQNPRQDGVQEFLVTKSLVKEYQAATEQCFQAVTPEEQQHVYGLFGDQDTVVHTFDLFMEHYPQAIRFHGEHRLNDKVLLHYIIPVIRWIDDKQEGRDRPSVYIDYTTLQDSYGKPKSSLNKAYEYLIGNYNVYFLAPAPTSRPLFLQEVQEWITEHISAPAWNRIIFTNQPEHVYGDYFIRVAGSENRVAGSEELLGTTLLLGSDEMKTWEDIITFFERLGGQ